MAASVAAANPGGGNPLSALYGGPTAAAASLHVALDVACGLRRLHAAGIVHGDISAGNVLLAAAPPPEADEVMELLLMTTGPAAAAGVSGVVGVEMTGAKVAAAASTARSTSEADTEFVTASSIDTALQQSPAPHAGVAAITAGDVTDIRGQRAPRGPQAVHGKAGAEALPPPLPDRSNGTSSDRAPQPCPQQPSQQGGVGEVLVADGSSPLQALGIDQLEAGCRRRLLLQATWVPAAASGAHQAHPAYRPAMVAKVSDFGLSLRLEGGRTHASGKYQGTPLYMAPEVMSMGRLGKAADGESQQAASVSGAYFACVRI